MKVAIIAAMWGRPSLIPAWWAQMERIKKQWGAAGIHTDVIVSGSEPPHQDACIINDGMWVMQRNRPLGRKHNACAKVAQRLGCDFLWPIGSDDFFTPARIEQYIPLIKAGIPYAGIEGCYFWETLTNKMGHFVGYPEGNRIRSLGTGRLIHKSLLDPVDWRPWDQSLNRALDASIDRNLNYPNLHKIPDTSEALTLDIKTGTNIWSFEHLVKHYPCLNDPIDVDSILSKMPEHDLLASLKLTGSVPPTPVHRAPRRPRVFTF